MKEFDNIMNKRLIYLNTDKNTVLENLVAPPELHLLIGAVFSLGKTLTVPWKIHIICSHVFPSVKHAGCSLSMYAEQCGEAIHAKLTLLGKDINVI